VSSTDHAFEQYWTDALPAEALSPATVVGEGKSVPAGLRRFAKKSDKKRRSGEAPPVERLSAIDQICEQCRTDISLAPEYK
jgi:hypothetical protein